MRSRSPLAALDAFVRRLVSVLVPPRAEPDEGPRLRLPARLSALRRRVALRIAVLRPAHTPPRRDPRRWQLRRATLAGTGTAITLMVNSSPGGLGLVVLGRGGLGVGEVLPVVGAGLRWARVAHARRIAPGISRVGLAFLPERPAAAAEARVYLAA
jgi:hypothetical protein